MKFLGTNLDLDQAELQKAVIEAASTFPENPVENQVFVNNAEVGNPQLYVFLNSVWNEVSNHEATALLKGIIQLTGDLGGTATSPQVTQVGGQSATNIGNLISAASLSQEYTGFPNRTDSVFSFTDATRTFSIAPVSTSFDYYQNSVKYTKTVLDSVQISNTSGIWFIYYVGTTLTASQTAWDLSASVPVCILYWNATLAQALFLCEERHGLVMDWATHEYLHNINGTRYINGFNISGYTLNTDSDSAVQIQLANGGLADEDILINIAHAATPINAFEQYLLKPAKIPVFYKEGITGEWRKDTATDFYFKNTTNGLVNYNSFTTTWGQTEVSNGYFVAYWIFATNKLTEPIIAVQGQRQDNLLTSAKDFNTFESLVLGSFFVEFKLLYRVILQTKTSYVGERKALIADVVDYRTTQTSASSVSGSISPYHSSLQGLDYTSSGHIGFEPRSKPLSTITTTYSVLDTDTVLLLDATTASFTVTLPAASTQTGKPFVLKLISSGQKKVGITSVSGTIDGDSTYYLSKRYQSVTVISDGTNWFII